MYFLREYAAYHGKQISNHNIDISKFKIVLCLWHLCVGGGGGEWTVCSSQLALLNTCMLHALHELFIHVVISLLLTVTILQGSACPV